MHAATSMQACMQACMPCEASGTRAVWCQLSTVPVPRGAGSMMQPRAMSDSMRVARWDQQYGHLR